MTEEKGKPDYVNPEVSSYKSPPYKGSEEISSKSAHAQGIREKTYVDEKSGRWFTTFEKIFRSFDMGKARESEEIYDVIKCNGLRAPDFYFVTQEGDGRHVAHMEFLGEERQDFIELFRYGSSGLKIINLEDISEAVVRDLARLHLSNITVSHRPILSPWFLTVEPEGVEGGVEGRSDACRYS